MTMAPRNMSGTGTRSGDHPEGDGPEQVVDRHVDHETNREGDRPHAGRNELDREDERRQVPLGAGQVLHVADAVRLKPVEVEER